MQIVSGSKKKKRKLRYKKMDPLKNMAKIDCDYEKNDDLSDVFPFEDVKDSAAYVKELRKNTWMRPR